MISVPADTFTPATAHLSVTLLKENAIKIPSLGASCKLAVTEQTRGKSKPRVRVYGSVSALLGQLSPPFSPGA